MVTKSVWVSLFSTGASRTLVMGRFLFFCFFFSSRRRHTRLVSDWSSDVCSSDLSGGRAGRRIPGSFSLGLVLRESLICAAALREGFQLGGRTQQEEKIAGEEGRRSEERRVGKEGRSRWSPYH